MIQKRRVTAPGLLVALIAGFVLTFGMPPAVGATPLLPGAFTSLGTFTPVAGAYVANTTTLKLTGPGTNFTGVNSGGIAVFTFNTVSIPVGATIVVTGTRPLALMSLGTMTVAGLIDGNADNGRASFSGGNGALGGPGGSRGGSAVPDAGQGSGGGGPSNNNAGAAGGGFGGGGASGANTEGDVGAPGGPVYGDLFVQLQGGSGGGGASNTEGGGGGGAIQLSAVGNLTIAGTAIIRVNGGWGDVGGFGGAGGGSGGGVILYSGATLALAGGSTVSARGGDGGQGGCCGHGGGGGGGRVLLIGRAVSNSGLISVAGGISGDTDTTSCCMDGIAGPDPSGALGVVTVREPTVTPTAGTPQSVGVGQTFATAFQVVVRDELGNPMPNMQVAFAAPLVGPSGLFGASSNVTVMTNAAGVATAPAFTANNISGTYNVAVSVEALGKTTEFALTNIEFRVNLPLVIR